MFCLSRALLVLTLALNLSACNFFDDEPIRVGFLGTLSGPNNFLGTSARDGALLAVAEANQQGGINGRLVELVIRDDRYNQAQAQQALSELIKEDVVSVIGPMTSEIATSINEIANQHQTVLISPVVSTQELAEKDDYFMRLYPTAAEGTVKIAHFAYNDRLLESFTIVYDMTNASFSLSWLENFKQDYLKVGGSIAAQIPFESQKKETSYLELAQRIKASGSQGLLILANPFSTAMICQNLDKINAELERYATEWSYGPDLIQYGGRGINQLMLFKTYFK
ncbi:MAG: amino acid ABC transporter substrate-binding protein, partial [Gammaproteobacteria bacterium]|nr:amino acid ABC transporter substrate-binding protein [Gammaproteobacteria bacterium]